MNGGDVWCCQSALSSRSQTIATLTTKLTMCESQYDRQSHELQQVKDRQQELTTTVRELSRLGASPSAALPGLRLSVVYYYYCLLLLLLLFCAQKIMTCDNGIVRPVLLRRRSTLSSEKNTHFCFRGGAWAGCGPAQSPPSCTRCNSPPINGQCTNFIESNYSLQPGL